MRNVHEFEEEYSTDEQPNSYWPNTRTAYYLTASGIELKKLPEYEAYGKRQELRETNVERNAPKSQKAVILRYLSI